MNDNSVQERVQKWHKAAERFKDLVCTSTNRSESQVSLRKWSLEIHIFQVSVGFDWFFSISGSLLNLLTDEEIMNIIEKFISMNPPHDEEVRSYCFIDQLYNINDIYELQERVHVLYLDPAYCQNCTLIWDGQYNVFKTNVNGSAAFFAYRDILKPNECVRDFERFRSWVSMTQESKGIEPFQTSSLTKEDMNSLNYEKSRAETNAVISSEPYK